jgi:dedicated sortase system histidine kinase
VSIRLQLLLVALTTLVLPWAGCQYARELEAALRGAQENALMASAGTIANALSAQPGRVFRDTGDAGDAGARGFSAAAGDLYVYPLSSPPLLDGYRNWNVAAEPTPLPTDTGYAARIQAASDERYLYVYLEVDDTHFDPEPNDVNPERDHFDRVDLTMQAPLSTPAGTSPSYFFGTNAPGLIAAQTVVKDDDGTQSVTAEPRIQAYWLQSAAGYHLEARIPLSFVGERLWVQAIDGRGRHRAGLTADEDRKGGRLVFATPGLDALLATFIRDGTRATVIDGDALKLGGAGDVGRSVSGDSDDLKSSWYRFLLRADTQGIPVVSPAQERFSGPSVEAALAGRVHAQWALKAGDRELLLTAAAPILIDGAPRGAVVLEQAADQALALRDGALTRLFNLTLIAAACVAIIMFAYATWLGLRIGRLRAAADSAVGSDGAIRLEMPESSSADEIGDLSRGFERLLERLNQHTLYLRTLGGKLSHELRTPLTIVRSSLDNLESEGLRADQAGYIRRAREGTARLQSILSALGAAARVEESIKQSERVSFDLCELLKSTVAAYRDGFPAARIELEIPPDACFLRGAPDLIVQLLDKLIENAVDFCAPAGAITVRLERRQSQYALQVSNDGTPIPEALMGRLFESLFEHREGRDEKPHFGLGLYIVRLIAEFHGGRAVAANRTDGTGAIFTVTLPMI